MKLAKEPSTVTELEVRKQKSLVEVQKAWIALDKDQTKAISNAISNKPDPKTATRRS